jgi:hypothetical protein
MTADQIGWKFSDGPNVVVAVLEEKIKQEDGSEEIRPSRAIRRTSSLDKEVPRAIRRGSVSYGTSIHLWRSCFGSW